MISAGAGLAVLGLAGLTGAAIRARSGARLRSRLGGPRTQVARGERSPVLAGVAEKFRATRLGEVVYEHAARTHPAIRFSDFLAMLLSSTIAGGLIGQVLFAAPGPTLLLSTAGPIVLDRVLLRVANRRAARLERALPAALMAQSAAMRAGRSLTGSIRVAASKADSPLDEELGRAIREIELGRPFDRVMETLSVRCASRDVELWVTAMEVHRQTGGDLPLILDALSDGIRERIRHRGELSALTAQGRMSGLVVGAAPLGFFLLLSITAREQMRFLYSTRLGFGLLIVGLLSEVIGFLWIRTILRAAR